MVNRRMNNGTLEILGDNGEVLLNISEKMDGDTLRVALSGEVRNEAAHEFEDEIMAALSVCSRIVLDFGGVTYIAGMALRSLLSVQQTIDGMDKAEMRLVNVQEPVMSVFRESGFAEILDIEENVKHA